MQFQAKSFALLKEWNPMFNFAKIVSSIYFYETDEPFKNLKFWKPFLTNVIIWFAVAFFSYWARVNYIYPYIPVILIILEGIYFTAHCGIVLSFTTYYHIYARNTLVRSFYFLQKAVNLLGISTSILKKAHWAKCILITFFILTIFAFAATFIVGIWYISESGLFGVINIWATVGGVINIFIYIAIMSGVNICFYTLNNLIPLVFTESLYPDGVDMAYLLENCENAGVLLKTLKPIDLRRIYDMLCDVCECTEEVFGPMFFFYYLGCQSFTNMSMVFIFCLREDVVYFPMIQNLGKETFYMAVAVILITIMGSFVGLLIYCDYLRQEMDQTPKLLSRIMHVGRVKRSYEKDLREFFMDTQARDLKVFSMGQLEFNAVLVYVSFVNVLTIVLFARGLAGL